MHRYDWLELSMVFASHTPDPDKPVRLRNATCIYCGGSFGDELKRTKEHVIARNFVPGVAFDAQWNLIAWACVRCNHEKSELEDDAAAITMQPDVWSRYGIDDPRLRDHAARKATGSISRRTGKPVAASGEALTLKGELMPGVSVSAKLVCSPQLDPYRAFALARFHLQGFFYLITYDRKTKQGHTWRGEYGPVAVVPRSDWGNDQMRSFQELLGGWQHRVRGICADEFFKVVIRRSPLEVPLWGWGLEWNASYRLIGFLGNSDAMRDTFESLLQLDRRVVEQTPGYTTSVREERAMRPDEDRLFATPEEYGENPTAP